MSEALKASSAGPVQVVLGIGSNIEPESNIAASLAALRARFGELAVSPRYRAAAVGFSGDDFINLVVSLITELPLAALNAELKAIEKDFGRADNAPRFSPRHIDLDILFYGDYCGDYQGIVLPREEILRNAFVLKPLADLLPDQHHPLAGKSCAELWRDFSGDRSLITLID